MNWPMVLRSTASLRGQRVMVAEDCYLVAQELVEALEREGAEIIGPAATIDDAQHLASTAFGLDAAVLDVNLRGRMIWPVADMLSRCRVRLVFVTGYAAAPIRQRYGQVPIAEKPVPPPLVARLVAGLLASHPAPRSIEA